MTISNYNFGNPLASILTMTVLAIPTKNSKIPNNNFDNPNNNFEKKPMIILTITTIENFDNS